MTTTVRAGGAAALLLMSMAAAPVPAAQILEAADGAELEAEISATGVNRIALIGDRIARVVRTPGGFVAEHDPGTGDLYLKPLPTAGPDGVADDGPLALFIGTEKGLTYQLALSAVARDSAQILIRNAAASPVAAGEGSAEAHVAGLVRLVRAVARREPLPGYEIEAGAGAIEVWRGARFDARVVEAAGAGDAAEVAARFAGAAAAWLRAPGSGPAGGRVAVVVVERRAEGAAP